MAKGETSNDWRASRAHAAHRLLLVCTENRGEIHKDVKPCCGGQVFDGYWVFSMALALLKSAVMAPLFTYIMLQTSLDLLGVKVLRCFDVS